MDALSVRAAALLVLALAATPAGARNQAPPPPTGELRLDMDDPVIDVRVGRTALRLRVGLEQKRLIELNPAAVERLMSEPSNRKLRFEPGFDALVGRETLKGVEAAAEVMINGRRQLVLLASHGRNCCTGVDGEIGVGLLPYATVRFARANAADAGSSADFLIDDDSEHGPQASLPLAGAAILLQFSLSRPDSVATASAGAILARAYGGRLGASAGPTVAAFGIARPTAMLRFPHPVALAGFAFEQIPVRTADFAGRFDFPSDPSEPGDIVVRRKTDQQPAWPVVLVGRDRTDRCSEALFDTIVRRLTLRCAFNG